MKSTKLTSIILFSVAFLSFVACKKSDNILPSDDNQYIMGVTRVLGVKGTDTASTKFMTGRIETNVVLASDQDSKLKAELIGYQPLGAGMALYTLRAINLTTCQSIIRWNWQGLTIDSISPPSDVIHAGDTVIFKLWGDNKIGKITLNGQADNPTSCGNSKTLVINITQSILPTRFTTSTVKREGDKMIVTFNDEAPQDTDWYFVMWSPDGNPANEVMKYSIVSDGSTKSHTTSFPAVRVYGK